MRKAFTLIELMIVIAIIAIIAAIAIPNLLESRISSNEAAAGTSLRSGVFPAQVTYQAGKYVDDGGPATYIVGGNGIGDFAAQLQFLAGFTSAAFVAHAAGAWTAGSESNGPLLPLSLLPPTWSAIAPTIPAGAANYIQATLSSYNYCMDSMFETSFCAEGWPVDTSGGTVGRRMFALNATGQVYCTNPNTLNVMVAPSGTAGVSPFGALMNSGSAAGWSPYRR